MAGATTTVYSSDGTLKGQVDKGEYVAEDISYVDDKTRQFYMTASGREDGEDPYFMHNYRVNVDGSGMKLLDPGDALARRQRVGQRQVLRR